jgi:hypothetical protein
MSKVTVELEWEAVDSIIVQQVTQARDAMKMDLKNRKKKNSKNAIFHTDRKKDVKMIEQHIESFENVVKYFGGKV